VFTWAQIGGRQAPYPSRHDNINFHRNPSNGSTIDMCVGEWKEVTKTLVGAFHDYNEHAQKFYVNEHQDNEDFS